MVYIFDNLLILIDGFFYFYCVFYVYLGIMSNGEILINVIYGVVNMICSMMC